MKTTGLEITNFMADDKFWGSASTSNETYLVNGQPFDGNIMLVKAMDDVVITGGTVSVKNGVEVSLATFFEQWQAQETDDIIAVKCSPDRRTELINLLREKGFELVKSEI